MNKALRTAIGVDELLLLAGLLLVTAGLWAQWGRLALVVPGAVFVWIALPCRTVFVLRPTSSAVRGAAHVVGSPPSIKLGARK